jgi:cell wall-associated NlpC family hydrolase
LLSVAAVLAVTGTVVPRAMADDGVDQAKARVRQIAAQLNAMSDRLAALDEEHGATLDRIDKLSADIADQEAQIQAQESVLGQLQSQLAAIAVDKFTNGGTAGLTPLFSTAAAFTDELQRGQLARVALDQGAGTTDDLNQLLTDLAKAQQALKSKQTQQAQLAQLLADKLQQGQDLEAQLQQQQVDAQQQYGDAVVAERERLAAEAEAAAAAAAARARSAAASAAAQSSQAKTTRPRGGGTGSSSSSSGSSGSTSGGTTTSGGGSSSSGSGDSGGSSSDTGSGSSGGGSSVPAPSSRASMAIAAAQAQLGTPYKFAMESPGVAFDCSGLTKYAWGKAGVALPHQSAGQFASLPHVPLGEIQPGDLLFYGSPIHHVALYIGNGLLIHAPATGDVVKVASINFATIVGAARPG